MKRPLYILLHPLVLTSGCVASTCCRCCSSVVVPSPGWSEINLGQFHSGRLELEFFHLILGNNGSLGLGLPLKLSFGFLREVIRESAVRSHGAIGQRAERVRFTPFATAATARTVSRADLLRFFDRFGEMAGVNGSGCSSIDARRRFEGSRLIGSVGNGVRCRRHGRSSSRRLSAVVDG